MKPWIHLDSAAIPGGGEMQLFQHVRDFAIRVGRDDLMNSGTHGSEEQLASLAIDRLSSTDSVRVLIGGLGMGYTVAAALRCLGPQAQLTVAELVPGVVAWNRSHLAHLAGNPLADQRVQIHVGDVAELLRANTAAYDLILLDVDNGPHAMTSSANHWLYGLTGLKHCHHALDTNGILAVWSAGPDPSFSQRLRATGFREEALRVPAHGSKGRRHVIWLANRGSSKAKA